MMYFRNSKKSPFGAFQKKAEMLLPVFTMLLLCCYGCHETTEGSPIAVASFRDIEVDLSLPEYAGLRHDKSHIILNGGLRGIILFHNTGSQYIAYEITCSFQPGDAAANVRVAPSALFLTDDSCGSQFSIPEGLPLGGPARSPLRIYKTSLTGSKLKITDESANGY